MEEIEEDRQKALASIEEEYKDSPREGEWRRLFLPGSYGCHELLDRVNICSTFIDATLLGHPSCILQPEWFATASKIIAMLEELYQQVGQIHLSTPAPKEEEKDGEGA